MDLTILIVDYERSKPATLIKFRKLKQGVKRKDVEAAVLEVAKKYGELETIFLGAFAKGGSKK